MNTEEQQTVEATAAPRSTSMILRTIIALVLVYVGYTYFMKPSSNTPETTASPSKAMVETASPSATTEKEITLAEIATHATKTDCWFAIEGTVYDVTKYIEANKHPGGEAVIEGCGKDATELFNTRPMGSGTPHSDKARNYVTNFKIGMLKK